MNAIIASAILGFAASVQASVLATASGHAKVVSNCPGNVYLSAVACDTSIAPTNAVLNSANPSFSQAFTEVTGNCGWAIKIGNDSSLPAGNILQYEYTWQGPGQQVWYDMSLVNDEGEPVFPWAFGSSDTSVCNPDNSNYFEYATPETPSGMQIQCPSNVDLTLYLCGTGSSAVTSAASASASASSTKASTSTTPSSTSTSSSKTTSSTPTPSSTTSAAPSTTFATSTVAPSSSAPSTTAAPSSSAPSSSADSTTTTTRRWPGWSFFQNNVAVSSTVSASSATSATTAADGSVVTETSVYYVTEVATAYVTARDAAPTPAARKRHIHGHPHGVHHA